MQLRFSLQRQIVKLFFNMASSVSFIEHMLGQAEDAAVTHLYADEGFVSSARDIASRLKTVKVIMTNKEE